MMRRPRKTPPLAVGDDGVYRLELHKQKVGFVLWAYSYVEGDFEWSAYEDRRDAETDAREHYDVPIV